MSKNYHHGNLRQALIQAAVPVLKKKGLVGLSLRGLATALGVSHGAPYRHFSNKTALLEAIAATGFVALQDICQEAERRFPEDPRKQLYEAGMGYIFYVARNPEIADLMFRPGLSPETSGADIQQAIDAAVGSLSSIIENGKREKLYSDHETMDLVLTSLATVHGLAMFIASGMLIDPAAPKDRIEALGKRVYDILMHGMENADSDCGP
ncbi:TetR family transcriptional regulator [Thiogranum longum]|uniref:TetR family transcriptional regulator n=1 Tax=Thiogranum longum TaxID=1537524 RepID=A0A4R1HL67_9GAMM|nr:TetR/AcrR family transcriptional regulator [Thiogranum longum]TCK17952.1 TetR family transcriptional regulator [Thiogranum longum]